MGKWAEISQNNIPFVLSSRFSISLVKMLSINVAVCCVILVGLNISGKNEDVNICSRNLLVYKSQDSDFKRSILINKIPHELAYLIFFVYFA